MTTAAELVQGALATIEVVSAEQAQRELESGVAVFVDVREPVEWEQHIPGAVQVPRGLLEFVADPTSARHDHRLDPEARLVVYCNSGGRGALAAQTLQLLGFANVANLAGGFSSWRESGHPTTEHHADL